MSKIVIILAVVCKNMGSVIEIYNAELTPV